MINQENLFEITRNKIISFCNQYLDKHPNPGFFYNQQELVRECIQNVTEVHNSDPYDLAMVLLKIKAKVIDYEKHRINITPGMFFSTSRGKFGQFRLELENSIRTLIGYSSYESLVEIDIDGDFRPQEVTKQDVNSHFNRCHVLHSCRFG